MKEFGSDFGSLDFINQNTQEGKNEFFFNMVIYK